MYMKVPFLRVHMQYTVIFQISKNYYKQYTSHVADEMFLRSCTFPVYTAIKYMSITHNVINTYIVINSCMQVCYNSDVRIREFILRITSYKQIHNSHGVSLRLHSMTLSTRIMLILYVVFIVVVLIEHNFLHLYRKGTRGYVMFM